MTLSGGNFGGEEVEGEFEVGATIERADENGTWLYIVRDSIAAVFEGMK